MRVDYNKSNNETFPSLYPRCHVLCHHGQGLASLMPALGCDAWHRLRAVASLMPLSWRDANHVTSAGH